MPRIEGVAAQDWLANDSKVSACIQATLIATINVSSVRGPHRLEAATQDAFNCKQSHSNQGTMRIARSIVPHPGSHQLKKKKKKKKKKKNVCFQLLMLAEESCLKDKRRNHFTGQMTRSKPKIVFDPVEATERGEAAAQFHLDARQSQCACQEMTIWVPASAQSQALGRLTAPHLTNNCRECSKMLQNPHKRKRNGCAKFHAAILST